MKAGFWWNWWVQFAVALGTFAAAIAAVFGSWIQSRCFKPKLQVDLLSERGEQTHELSTTGHSSSARYYHARVSNGRWPAATQVQVFLVRVEEPGPDQQLQIRWASEVPLRWRFQEVNPLTRTIGATADADLCRVVEGAGFSLLPIIVPNNLRSYVGRSGSFDLVLSVEVRSAKLHHHRLVFECLGTASGTMARRKCNSTLESGNCKGRVSRRRRRLFPTSTTLSGGTSYFLGGGGGGGGAGGGGGKGLFNGGQPSPLRNGLMLQSRSRDASRQGPATYSCASGCSERSCWSWRLQLPSH